MDPPISQIDKDLAINYITKKLQEMIKQSRSISGLNTVWNEQRSRMNILKKFLDYREDQACGRMNAAKDDKIKKSLNKELRKELPDGFDCLIQPYFFTHMESE